MIKLIEYILEFVQLFISSKPEVKELPKVKEIKEVKKGSKPPILLYDKYNLLYDSEGAEFEEEGLNICGFRDKSDMDKSVWNDYISLIYKDDYGNKVVEEFEATTDPSVHFTMKPYQEEGAAHLREGFYRNCWVVGEHKPKGSVGYTALCQWGGPVTCWRDKNKNFIDDDNTDYTGYFGINIHKGMGRNGKIYRASAGCQVVYYTKWNRFMDIVMSFERKRPGRGYSYLLTGIEKYRRLRNG